MWTLEIAGRRLHLADIEALEHDTFDVCSTAPAPGNSHQTWTGVRLDRLLDVGESM
jgi:hypothetical protein